jgi:phosphatidylglycerol:prolipoprotein diacylglycerol transferase
MGCFFAGCCHGGACDASEVGTLAQFEGGRVVTLDGAPHIGLVFTKGVGVGAIHDPVVTWPTQMLESVGALTLFLLLSLMWHRWRRFDGQVMASMLALYACMRATIERFRGDSIRGLHEVMGMQLSTSQLVAAAMVLVAAAIALWRYRYGVAPETPFEPDDEAELLV